MKNEIKKAVGYVRVSTKVQVKDGESLETQKRQIEEYCEFKKWKLVKIYEDAGVTGAKTSHRSGFLQMLEDAKGYNFDIVVFTKLSRFARNSRDYHQYQHELEKNKVTLASIKENIDPTSHNGRLMAGIFALLAEWEREMIREQMLENKLIKWQEKRMFNGAPPIGYIWDKKELKIIENKEESETIKKIFTWYTKLGYSMRDIRDQLNKEGLKSRRKGWTNGTLTGIFHNECYSTGKLHTNTRKYVDGKRTKELKPKEEWITYDVPKLITHQMYEEVKKRRQFNKEKQKRTTWQKEHWIRGSLFCGKCGSKMRIRKGNIRKDGTSTKYYICHWSNCSPRDLKFEKREKCSQGNVSSEQLEHYVWDALTFNLTGQHHNQLTEDGLKKRADEGLLPIFNENYEDKIVEKKEKIKRLKNELKQLTLANERLMDAMEEVSSGRQQIMDRYSSNDRKIVVLRENIEDANSELQELIKTQQKQNEFYEDRDQLFDLWSDLQEFDFKDKKRLLESLVPDGITVALEPNPHKGKAHSKVLGPDNVCFNVVWNVDIFQYFKDNGKLPSLCQNGSNHYAGSFI